MIPTDGEGIKEPPSIIWIRSSGIDTKIVSYTLFLIAFISFGLAIFRSGGLTELIISAIAMILVVLRFLSMSKVGIGEEGITVPSYWFLPHFISWKEVVNVQIFEEDKMVVLILDTTWKRIVRTGLSDIRIVLDNEGYVMDEFDTIAQTIERYWNQSKKVPDTLNERLMKQVNLAWNSRYFQWMTDTLDDFTFGLFLLFEINFIFYIFSGMSLPSIIYFVIIPILVVYTLFANFDVPNSIIAIRPHELGPLLYDDEDVVTSVRFVVMTLPNPLKLHSCEITYLEEQEHPQPSNFIQIHPKVIEPAELVHCVAQITGRHERADGAIVEFSIGEGDVRHKYQMIW